MSNLNMTKLDTIQKREKLNEVIRIGSPGPGGAHHEYIIVRADGDKPGVLNSVADIQFQKGPRAAQGSISGVCDQDLLEIVRDRLRAFQAGPMACYENTRALMYVEQALIHMNKRVEDRIKRGVLGTMQK